MFTGDASQNVLLAVTKASGKAEACCTEFDAARTVVRNLNMPRREGVSGSLLHLCKSPEEALS